MLACLVCTVFQACKPLPRKSVMFWKKQTNFQAQKFFFSLSSKLLWAKAFFLGCFVGVFFWVFFFFFFLFVSHRGLCLGSYKPCRMCIQVRQHHDFPVIYLVVLHTYEEKIVSPCRWFCVKNVVGQHFLKFWLWKVWFLKHGVANTRVLGN